MGKIVSYRQKLLELARIYKIDQVFDQNTKYTTYDIEIILLKNSVPIPSRKRGYLSHKFINEFFKPFYETVRKKLFINININTSRKNFYEGLRKKISINLKLKLNLNLNINKYFKKKILIKLKMSL